MKGCCAAAEPGRHTLHDALAPRALSMERRSERCREVRVVSISSVSSSAPYECFSVYGAGKAARLALTRTLAREAELVHNPWAEAQRSAAGGAGGDQGGPPSIRTLSYAPGALDTEMQVRSPRSGGSSCPRLTRRTIPTRCGPARRGDRALHRRQPEKLFRMTRRSSGVSSATTRTAVWWTPPSQRGELRTLCVRLAVVPQVAGTSSPRP